MYNVSSNPAFQSQSVWNNAHYGPGVNWLVTTTKPWNVTSSNRPTFSTSLVTKNDLRHLTVCTSKEMCLKEHMQRYVQFKLKLIYLRSSAKQVIPTYINYSRPLIPDGINLFFIEQDLRGERNQTCPYMLSAKEGNIWYHFYNVFGMTRSGIEPTTSRLRGKRSNHWATAAVKFTCT